MGAIAANITDPTLFSSGRHLAAWFGLVPRQRSSGGKERLGRISKQGDPYIRRLLVVGAHLALRYARGVRTRARSHGWSGFSPGGHTRSLRSRLPTRWRELHGRSSQRARSTSGYWWRVHRGGQYRAYERAWVIGDMMANRLEPGIRSLRLARSVPGPETFSNIGACLQQDLTTAGIPATFQFDAESNTPNLQSDVAAAGH